MSTTSRAAIYVRQSLDRAEGIDRQLRRCRALVEARAWAPSGEYTDNDTSATKARGPATAWARLLDDARNGAFDVVVAVNLDRLARNVQDVLSLSSTGVGIATLEGDLDTTSADGRFRAQLLASLAEFETSRKSERQRRANSDRAAKGSPNPGRRRFGYATDGRTALDAEAVVVRRIYAELSSGASVRGIAMTLDREGVSAGTAKRWSPRQVRAIATNPVYRGAVVHLGRATDSTDVEAIVDRETWDTVAALLADPARRTTPGNTPKHLLSGVARCECGAPLFFRNGYICRVSAAHVFMRKVQAEEAARDGLVKALLTVGRIGVMPAPASAARASLSARYAHLTRDIEVTADLVVSGDLPNDVGRQKLRSLRDERDDVVAELEAVRVAQAADAVLLDLAHDLLGETATITTTDVAAIGRSILEKFDSLDFDRQREALRGLVSIELRKGRSAERIRVEPRYDRSIGPDPELAYEALMHEYAAEGESQGRAGRRSEQ